MSPLIEGRDITRSQHVKSQILDKGGIEAALIQHDGMRLKREDKFSRSGAALNTKGSPVLTGVSPPTLAASPLRLGMNYFSLDMRNEGLRPSVSRLVAPDIIPRDSRYANTIDGFQPLEPRRKTLSQTQIKSRNDAHNYNNASKLLHRRKSQWDEHNGSKRLESSAVQPTDVGSADDPQRTTQTTSPQRVKIKTHINRKPHQQQSYRHRQKLWVLNPFRQEDEEEVLAKRTHNRRRWSHVFPLGEDEFKRHAGPNWKSLCQPAICEYF